MVLRNNHRGSRSSCGHGTEQNLETRGKVAEVSRNGPLERSGRVVPFRIQPWWIACAERT